MLRIQIAQALEYAGLLGPALAIRARTRSPWLPVLTYHRVAHREVDGLYDDGVIDVRPAAFERQLSFLRRWFSVIELDDVLAFKRGRPLPKNPVLVTFDDGYKDNFDVALPILKRHGIKATFFIATHYVGERRLFWWDRINFVIKSSKREALALSYPSPVVLPLRSSAERAAAIHYTLRVVKDYGGLDFERFLDGLAHAADISLGREDERRMADDLLMTWDHVRGLRQAGMDVQSHTRTHRGLHTVDADVLREELGGSRELLESVLGERVRAISYPVGKPLKSTPGIRDAVKAAGYELGFSNATGANRISTFDLLDAKRLSLEADLPDAHFLAMLAFPPLAY